MSLHEMANYLASKGRNGDEELVHMTKGEVAGLQSLAEAAGGSLTINPETGKPEAFFLAALLPTILGAAAPALGAAATGAGMAGLGGLLSGKFGAMGLGALTGALMNRNDPLMGAVMGGMGGYGGGQLAQGMGLGVPAASASTAPAAATTVTPSVSTSIVPGAPASSITPAAASPLTTSITPATTAPVSTPIIPTPPASSITPAVAGAPSAAATTPTITPRPEMTGKQMMTSGLMALAPAMMPRTPEAIPEEEDTEDVMGRYTYDSGYTGGTLLPGAAFTSERRFFNPRFIRNMAQGGAVKKFADGGEMSAPSSDPARGMTGASADAMRFLYGMDAAPGERVAAGNPAFGMTGQSAEAMQYLTGQLPTTSRVQPAPLQAKPFVAPVRARETASSIEGMRRINDGEFSGMYEARTPKFAFDPGSQKYFRTDPVFTYVAPEPSYDAGSSGYAEGGITDLARGGMKAGGFVVPADVVSMVGEGNTDAGYERIRRMIPGATAIKGKDGGQADTVATSIEGKQPARVAHGEMYVPPAAVKRAGGAKKLYAMMKNVRQQATGRKAQIKPVNLKKAMA